VKHLCWFIVSLAFLACVTGVAAAQKIPLPRPRPPELEPSASVPVPEPSQEPSACRLRLTSDIAIAPSLPPITGPGECEAPDVVRLEAVMLPDHSSVAVAPPAILRCPMAEAVASWVREDAAQRVGEMGSSLKGIETLASFDCRGRNNIPGAKLSEHGRANALDIHALRLADGKRLVLTDPQVDKELREGLRQSACARFTTVLGPGSDGFHEEHVHVDLAERRGGYRICQWDVREAGPASVPLPRPRPYGGEQ
jgi:hypothetical protein